MLWVSNVRSVAPPRGVRSHERASALDRIGA